MQCLIFFSVWVRIPGDGLLFGWVQQMADVGLNSPSQNIMSRGPFCIIKSNQFCEDV